MAKESSKLLVLAMRQDSVHEDRYIWHPCSICVCVCVFFVFFGTMILLSMTNLCFDLRVGARFLTHPIPTMYMLGLPTRDPLGISIPDKENPIMTLAPQAYVNIYYATQLSGLFAQSLKRTRYCRFSRWYASFC